MPRRLIASTLGLAATVLLWSAGNHMHAAPAPFTMTGTSGLPLRVYVGTYTGRESRGIYLLELDPSSGRWLSEPTLAAPSENPSFLALHPTGRFLYAVNELSVFQGEPTGSLSAFAVDAASGRLTVINRQPSEGIDPCHLTIDAKGRHVLVANYTSGSVAVLPLAADGRLERASSIRRRTGSGPVRARQEGPHAHAVALDRSGRFAVSADLGTDRVNVDRFDDDAGRLEPNDPDGVGLVPGSGPRHVAWHPEGRVLYVLNELSSSVTALRFDPGRGALDAFQAVSARAAGAAAENTGAEIAVSPDGRFLYTSNRGDDNIAVFAIDQATLRLRPAGHVPTGGRRPRSFAIDPTGRWLVAANQDSNSLILFRLDPATGLPVAVGQPVSVPEPVCVLFASREL